MNKQEALQALRAGEKVSHIFMEHHEYLQFIHQGIYTEDMILFDAAFSKLDTEAWQQDWFIYNQHYVGC
jgi:hemerythrin-like domain-containing protein